LQLLLHRYAADDERNEGSVGVCQMPAPSHPKGHAADAGDAIHTIFFLLESPAPAA